MKSYKQSIQYMLSYSYVSFIFIAILFIVTTYIQFNLFNNYAKSGSNFSIDSIFITFVLAIFIGPICGGALNGLKQNYLWVININYKKTLIISFLSILFVFNLFQVIALLYTTQLSMWVLVLPFCISVFSSFLVLGKTIIHKILIPSVPILINQFNIDFEVKIVIMILSTLILIVSMFFNFSQTKQFIKSNNDKSFEDPISKMYLSKYALPFNFFIGVYFSKWIENSKKKVDWFIFTPLTKLGVMPIFYLFLLIVSMMIMTDDHEKSVSEIFALMFLSISITDLIMGPRKYFRQIRTIAHLFGGQNQRKIRQKLLTSIDKTYIINTVFFVSGFIIISKLLSSPINYQTFLFPALAISLFSLAYYPILLCQSWINISFKLVISISIFAWTIYNTVSWITTHIEDILNSPIIYLFVLGCVLLRFVSQYVFYQYPNEKLIKNK